MAHIVDVQIASTETGLPTQAELIEWALVALNEATDDSEITIRIVDEVESADLNRTWRSKEGATNVLSFPSEKLDIIRPVLLGDIVICAPVIASEASEQNKKPESHWAHMVIHGTLHLLGYDHIDEEQANCMESLEIAMLNSLNINNPYN